MSSAYIVLFIIIIPVLLYSVTQLAFSTFKININKNIIAWSALLFSIVLIGIIARTYRISFAWVPLNPETSSPGSIVILFIFYCIGKCLSLIALFIIEKKKSRSSRIESSQTEKTYEDPVPESFLTKFLEPGIIIMGILAISQLFLRKEHIVIFFWP